MANVLVDTKILVPAFECSKCGTQCVVPVSSVTLAELSEPYNPPGEDNPLIARSYSYPDGWDREISDLFLCAKCSASIRAAIKQAMER